MENAAAAAAGTGSASIGNVHYLAAFIPTFDGSYPVQDFFEEITDAAKIGNWADNITLKVAKSKILGPVADMVRNRHDLNHAATFEDFQYLLISALHTDKPVSVRLQDLMTCVQNPSESVDAYATRMRQKSKSLTEWDATPETKELKNRTITAAFIKGLKPNLRQLVVPVYPSDFEAAIALARSHEISEPLMPFSDLQSHSPASASAGPNSSESAMLDMQRRVASLELSAAQSSSRGRGHTPTRGRGRGRPRHHQNFQNQQRFRQSQSWTPRPQQNSFHRYSRPDGQQAHYSVNSRCSSCHGCYDRNSRYRSHSRHGYDRQRNYSRSPSHEGRYFHRGSRSPNRDRQRHRHPSRSLSASPSRSRYQSPNGYRSRN